MHKWVFHAYWKVWLGIFLSLIPQNQPWGSEVVPRWPKGGLCMLILFYGLLFTEQYMEVILKSYTKQKSVSSTASSRSTATQNIVVNRFNELSSAIVVRKFTQISYNSLGLHYLLSKKNTVSHWKQYLPTASVYAGQRSSHLGNNSYIIWPGMLNTFHIPSRANIKYPQRTRNK